MSAITRFRPFLQMFALNKQLRPQLPIVFSRFVQLAPQTTATRRFFSSSKTVSWTNKKPSELPIQDRIKDFPFKGTISDHSSTSRYEFLKIIGEIDNSKSPIHTIDLISEFLTDEILINIVNTCPELKKIRLLFSNKITDQAIIEIAKKYPKLEYIKLSGLSLLTDQSLMALVKDCFRLIGIDLCYQKFSEAAVRQLVLRHQDHLMHIDLSYMNLTEVAFLHLSGTCPNLKTLNLTSCQVNDRGIILFAIQCPNLIDLNIDWCDRLTDIALDGLAANAQNLRNLSLFGCFFNEAAVLNLITKCKELKTIQLPHKNYNVLKKIKKIRPDLEIL